MTFLCQEIMMNISQSGYLQQCWKHLLCSSCIFFFLSARTANAFICYSVTSTNLSPRDPWRPSLSLRHLDNLAPHLYISPQDKTVHFMQKLSVRLKEHPGWWEKAEGKFWSDWRALSCWCRHSPGERRKRLTFPALVGHIASEYNASKWALTSRGEINPLRLPQMELCECCRAAKAMIFLRLKSFVGLEWAGGGAVDSVDRVFIFEQWYFGLATNINIDLGGQQRLWTVSSAGLGFFYGGPGQDFTLHSHIFYISSTVT